MEKEGFHFLSESEVFEKLSGLKKGLSSKEAKHRLSKYGKNELPEKKAKNPIFIFLNQFRSFLVYILVVAGVVSFFSHHIIDVYVIVAVILINAGIGFSQENKAEKAIRALKKMVVAYSKVYRDGELLQIPAGELVPGDIISLEEGDRIPADARIFELKNFRTVESSLTGESFPTDKFIKILPEKTALGDRVNMVFMGTFVALGSARAIVVATGVNTEIGKVAKDIESVVRVQSHFKRKSDVLAKQMALMAFVGAIVTFLIGYFIRGFEFTEMFLVTIAVLVSAIPEGLPAVLAIVLAVGAFRMSRRKAIVRNLPATETLGVVSTIITDKTGTLTENTMNVERILMPGHDEIKVFGNGWEPVGEFRQKERLINPLDNKQLEKLLKISLVCNNASLFKEKNHKEEYKIVGDPTEASLIVLAKKAKLKKLESKIDDLPFNSELKYRASLSGLVGQENKKQIYVVGAPETVLEKSTYFLNNGVKQVLSENDKNRILSKVDGLTKSSMRVLALAYKDTSRSSLSDKGVDKLIFVGVVGIRDPPRIEVEKAIEKARKAGVRVVMVTGDHKGTALAVAEDIGLIKNKIAYTGQELSEMSDSEFSKVVKTVNVFARLTPKMKLRIAGELQKQGEVIAMTGDGVNDAPALKKADIGISMGVIGTDVARESSEIILADDNFASIVNAIEEGRIVFTNTRQASGFLVTTNFAELATIITTLSLGMPLPLLPTQILWLNLVTDGVPDVALAMEPGHHDVLNEKPRSAKENILNKEILGFLILVSAVMVLSTLFIFSYYLPEGLDKARTGAFVVMSFTQLFNVLNMRSLKKSFFKIGMFTNKFLSVALVFSALSVIVAIYLPFFQKILGFVSLSFTEFILAVLLSSLVFVFGEGYKFVRLSIKKRG